jgi:hypothetical protein
VTPTRPDDAEPEQPAVHRRAGPRRLNRRTLSVLATAAQLADDRPINTVDLLLATLATAADPASGVLGAVGVTTGRVLAADRVRTESGRTRVSGFVVTAEFAAVARAALDWSSPVDLWSPAGPFPLPEQPVPGDLLAAALGLPTDVARLLAGLDCPVDILPFHLRTGIVPTRPHQTIWLDRPFQSDPRGGPRIRAVRFAVVAGSTLALLCAVLGLDALVHAAGWTAVLIVPTLGGLIPLIRLLRPGRLALCLTIAVATVFLLIGFADLDYGPNPIPGLVVLAVLYLAGVACCARGRRRPRRSGTG